VPVCSRASKKVHVAGLEGTGGGQQKLRFENKGDCGTLAFTLSEMGTTVGI
jgi:hypothetical protein